jgi:hypothetical protein
MLNGGTLEHAQQIAAHQSPRTTKLYDRTKDEISLDEVERIKGGRVMPASSLVVDRFYRIRPKHSSSHGSPGSGGNIGGVTRA